ncbi:unnamed protein product [Aphis gossypii]|uniref:Uncharacterized protein n=1 Tax=Aphis gossypii TaxID=80765 RepID=A0A9P0IS41_APHGO|nr:unnamed protein product [Aphis gossypii]
MDVNNLGKVDEDLASNIKKKHTSALEMDDISSDKYKDEYERNCKKLIQDVTKSLCIMKGINNFQDFNTTRNKLKNKELKPPKSCNKLLMNFFKISSTEKKSKLEGPLLNEYLKDFLIDNINIATDHPSLDTKISYDDLLKFLQNRKETIKITKIKPLKDLCIYGYFLHKFFISFEDESVENLSKTFQSYLEELSLSVSYARKLRWLGNTWFKNKKIGNLCISFTKFYSFKQQLESLFKDSNLAKEWQE